MGKDARSAAMCWERRSACLNALHASLMVNLVTLRYITNTGKGLTASLNCTTPSDATENVHAI